MKHLLAILACACGSSPSGWSFVNATPAQEVQGLALLDATRAITGAALEHGEVDLVLQPYGLDGWCPAPAGEHVSGCTYGRQIEILIMPERGLGPDLRTTALAHELCHVALRTTDETLANDCSAEVLAR